jgi:hypothetical protein
MNNKLERIQNESAVKYFNVLSWNFPVGPEYNHEDLSEDR